MNFKPILLVAGEPNSIFLEILFKIYKNKKIKSPLILIGSQKLIHMQMKKLNFKKKIRLLELDNIKSYKLDNSSINLINVKYNQKKAFEKISVKSKTYIQNCFEIVLVIENLNLHILIGYFCHILGRIQIEMYFHMIFLE